MLDHLPRHRHCCFKYQKELCKQHMQPITYKKVYNIHVNTNFCFNRPREPKDIFYNISNILHIHTTQKQKKTLWCFISNSCITLQVQFHRYRLVGGQYTIHYKYQKACVCQFVVSGDGVQVILAMLRSSEFFCTSTLHTGICLMKSGRQIKIKTDQKSQAFEYLCFIKCFYH